MLAMVFFGSIEKIECKRLGISNCSNVTGLALTVKKMQLPQLERNPRLVLV